MRFIAGVALLFADATCLKVAGVALIISGLVSFVKYIFLGIAILKS